MSSKSSSKAATTVKVAAQTGAAKDEFFGGFNEETANQILNILDNDPGSAKLWSLDQNALLAPASSQLPQNLASIVLASGATVSTNADGTVNYDGSSALQSLGEGEVFIDSFTYVIRMANGALSTATARVEVTGVNDVASFGGDSSGSVQEDGTLVTSGTLSVSDIDRGQSLFAGNGVISSAGSYGSFSFDTASGAWTYTLDNTNADVQALDSGDSLQDQLEVFSVDGSSTFVTVTIGGQDEVTEEPQDGQNWVLNRQNLVKVGGGLNAGIVYDGVDGIVSLEGFTSDDVIHYAGMGFVGFQTETVDLNANGTLDTLLTFSYDQGRQPYNVDVLLIDFVGFVKDNNLSFGEPPADPV